jgi:hypothetical protein
MRADAAHVARALHDDARLLGAHPELLQRLARDQHHAAAGRLRAPAAAAQIERLARHDRRDRARTCME